ncbi:E3 ubiquitin-protein ligase TRIM31-like [Ochotona curzoniae]|uniref:E3 ubiquitin-protein ligase TRIM31-like n=1 Tax=Ochotona curzoniae TaxID=130825 RepID=UPI001B34B3D3|nr:E3 ubiquitin-protein ligase TRIM31-like [Ochotona curzoniae]
MASQSFPTKLKQEVTCPICLEILRNPVTIYCGHSFCHSCITQLKETSKDFFKCPLCKSSMNKDSFLPNWLLGNLLRNLVEKIQAVDSSEMRPEEEELRCSKHGEKLHYFCEEDGELLCVVCRDSKDHKSHNTSVMEEAAQHHQEQIQVQVAALQQKEQELVHIKAQDEKKISNFMTQVESEKQRIHTEFKHLQQILEEKKSICLSGIECLAQEGTKECERYNTATQAQLNSLKDTINSLSTKQQMPPRQLLQDIKGTLKRSEEIQVQFHRTTPIPLELEKNLSEAKSRHDFIIDSLRKFGDQLQDDRKKDQGKFLLDISTTHRQSGPVFFNAASAHPELRISKDLKTVKLHLTHILKRSDDPVEPQRFYPFRCVLGSPGFFTGHHSWEVERSGPWGGICTVGVAWEQAPRQGYLTLEPASGFWVLHFTDSKCQALTGSNTWEDLPVCPRRVGVCVDFEGKEVSFHDAATKKHIYTFQASFLGKISPFFRLFPGTQITLSP